VSQITPAAKATNSSNEGKSLLESLWTQATRQYSAQDNNYKTGSLPLHYSRLFESLGSRWGPARIARSRTPLEDLWTEIELACYPLEILGCDNFVKLKSSGKEYCPKERFDYICPARVVFYHPKSMCVNNQATSAYCTVSPAQNCDSRPVYHRAYPSSARPLLERRMNIMIPPSATAGSLHTDQIISDNVLGIN